MKEMGDYQLLKENEGKKWLGQNQDQPSGHYRQFFHHQQQQQHQQPSPPLPQRNHQNQHQQQQQQLYGQQHQQQERGRQVSTLSTSELLGKTYILQVVDDAEIRLVQFDNSVSKKVGQQEIRQGRSFQQEMQLQKGENTTLKEPKDLLKNDKSFHYGQPTRLMKRPSPSGRPQSLCEVPTRNNDRIDKNNMRSVEELKQSKDARTRELEIECLKEENFKLLKEKEDLQLRLSKLAGEKLTENNPAIADLSDPNRPTKIGEMYSEVYSNEWTDAFEALAKAGYEDSEAIETLRSTLLNVIQFCSKKAESLLKKTEEAVNILFEEYKSSDKMCTTRHLTMPRKVADRCGKLLQQSSFDLDANCLQQRWIPLAHSGAGFKRNPSVMKPNKSGEVIAKQLKTFRKEVAVSMVPLVEKAYMSASWNEECVYHLKPFIRKCILLGWMMVVQSPPMALAEFEPNERLRKEFYKEYTTSGSHVEYVVWPALLLEKGGPVVGKGVAQGKKVN